MGPILNIELFKIFNIYNSIVGLLQFSNLKVLENSKIRLVQFRPFFPLFDKQTEHLILFLMFNNLPEHLEHYIHIVFFSNPSVYEYGEIYENAIESS
jgi:hypothetical protein